MGNSIARLTCAAIVALLLAPGPAFAGDANNGAKIVQDNGCMGCHGATFKGGLGPALYGIEHRLSASEIAARIKNPKAPMPKLSLTDSQIDDITSYLSGLDGGVGASARPVVAFDPATPNEEATISVTFPGKPPKHVSALPVMQMGSMSHHTDLVVLQPSAKNPNLFTGKVSFTMGGAWTVEIKYDDKTMTVPLNVGSGT